jgi:CubicO group peptidase (beta-lactamase class C family)
MTTFFEARQILLNATGGAFPAASVEVGSHDHVIWREAFGELPQHFELIPTTNQTVFDLASLTKVIATTSLVLQAVDNGLLRLDDTVAHWLKPWKQEDREIVTLADLLSHSSGLTSHLPFFRDHTGRVEFEESICSLPLEYVPRSKSVYSDLGFILLGFILETVTNVPLNKQFSRMAQQQEWNGLTFGREIETRENVAPTEFGSWRGRLLVAEVHDENTWALGGVAGHAGLFGTATAVGKFATTILRQLRGDPLLATPASFTKFVTRTSVPNSSRALGWDTMLTTSSCGTRMSSKAIGHTGFTGTSLWLDPSLDLYIVLLTNRVYLSRSNDAILEVRRSFHDAVVGALA